MALKRIVDVNGFSSSIKFLTSSKTFKSLPLSLLASEIDIDSKSFDSYLESPFNIGSMCENF